MIGIIWCQYRKTYLVESDLELVGGRQECNMGREQCE